MFQGTILLLFLISWSTLFAHAQDVAKASPETPTSEIASPATAPTAEQMLTINKQVVALEQQVARQASNDLAICKALGITDCEKPVNESDALPTVVAADTATPTQ